MIFRGFERAFCTINNGKSNSEVVSSISRQAILLICGRCCFADKNRVRVSMRFIGHKRDVRFTYDDSNAAPAKTISIKIFPLRLFFTAYDHIGYVGQHDSHPMHVNKNPKFFIDIRRITEDNQVEDCNCYHSQNKRRYKAIGQY